MRHRNSPAWWVVEVAVAETKYTPHSFRFKSKGLLARWTIDSPPDASYFLNQNGGYERSEDAMSSRYGNVIINHDPVGAGTSNYFFPSAPVTLARLKTTSQTYRYASLSNGSLWRRATDTQGPYAEILVPSGAPPAGLSGLPMTTLVTTCYESSAPWLFMFDRQSMLKDNGTGLPSRIGILPPVRPVTTQAYAPALLIIDPFTSTAGYTTGGGLTITGTTNYAPGGYNGKSQLSGNYFRYTNLTIDSAYPFPDGMIAVNVGGDQALCRKFQTNVNTGTFDIQSLSGVYPTNIGLSFDAVVCTVPASLQGTIGKTFSSAQDWSAYNAFDIFTASLRIDVPANVQEVRIQFDVAGSGFTTSYYTKSLIPASYQAYLQNPNTSTPVAAASNANAQQPYVYGGGSPGVYGGGSPGFANAQEQASIESGSSASQPLAAAPMATSTATSGTTGAWSVIYLQKGDFLAVGNAGQPGQDWSNITGWQIMVVTNTGGSAQIDLNALYLQGTAGLQGQPSSLFGVGYDIRYTYHNANTGTPSNASPPQEFSVTSTNPGGTSTLIPLQQAINAIGQYSADPQVTHVKFWVRGGLYGNNWYYADQIPNVTGTGTFNYVYNLPDSVLSQGDILNLANDVPVTSTLQSPVNTTLTTALAPSPANTNTPTLLTVSVAQAAVFVPNQVVFIGDPTDQEQVAVVTGGTGTFTAWVQLPHASGELVVSYSYPAQPVYLAAAAYSQLWMAGDPNNPHLLYYTPVGFPENCPPQNYIPVGDSPSDPITAVVNTQGILFARTLSTWKRIFPGNPPYAQSTGSQHGSPASFDWCVTENEIWYQSWDGIRTFKGTDGPYRSLAIEWLYRSNPMAIPTLVDLTQLSQVVGAFHNNTATFSYIGIDGNRHRLLYNTNYHRWRNDDVPVTAMLVESDTNTLVYAKPITQSVLPPAGGWVVVHDSYTQDYDDGGWVNGQLVQLPIPLTIQTPYDDQKMPHNPKNYNVLELDVNPNGQTIAPLLLFDDNNGNVSPVVPTPSTFTGAVRSKFQFQIQNGLGQQAYRVSLQLSGQVTAAPELYQADLYAAVLTDARSSYDTYQIHLAGGESAICKQSFWDYTATAPINVELFADGSAVPWFAFTLPANPTRSEVPMRVRHGSGGTGMQSMRLFRLVATSAASFQFWQPVEIEVKPLRGGPKGYNKVVLGDTTP
jgi:hypothetical protein